MSNEKTLDSFTKDELLALAEQFGVEVRASMTKAAVVKAFDEDGVTAELIDALRQPEADEDEVAEAPVVEPEVVEPAAPVVDEADLILVRMTRLNRTYEIRGYVFTKDDPYGLVTEDNADYLIETDGGFRMASPKEAREFYS